MNYRINLSGTAVERLFTRLVVSQLEKQHTITIDRIDYNTEIQKKWEDEFQKKWGVRIKEYNNGISNPITRIENIADGNVDDIKEILHSAGLKEGKVQGRRRYKIKGRKIWKAVKPDELEPDELELADGKVAGVRNTLNDAGQSKHYFEVVSLTGVGLRRTCGEYESKLNHPVMSMYNPKKGDILVTTVVKQKNGSDWVPVTLKDQNGKTKIYWVPIKGSEGRIECLKVLPADDIWKFLEDGKVKVHANRTITGVSAKNIADVECKLKNVGFTDGEFQVINTAKLKRHVEYTTRKTCLRNISFGSMDMTSAYLAIVLVGIALYLLGSILGAVKGEGTHISQWGIWEGQSVDFDGADELFTDLNIIMSSILCACVFIAILTFSMNICVCGDKGQNKHEKKQIIKERDECLKPGKCYGCSGDNCQFGLTRVIKLGVYGSIYAMLKSFQSDSEEYEDTPEDTAFGKWVKGQTEYNDANVDWYKKVVDGEDTSYTRIELKEFEEKFNSVYQKKLQTLKDNGEITKDDLKDLTVDDEKELAFESYVENSEFVNFKKNKMMKFGDGDSELGEFLYEWKPSKMTLNAKNFLGSFLDTQDGFETLLTVSMTIIMLFFLITLLRCGCAYSQFCLGRCGHCVNEKDRMCTTSRIGKQDSKWSCPLPSFLIRLLF